MLVFLARIVQQTLDSRELIHNIVLVCKGVGGLWISLWKNIVGKPCSITNIINFAPRKIESQTASFFRAIKK